MRDLFVNNAKLWSGNLGLILVGNLRLLTQPRKGHLELGPGNWSITLGKVRVLPVRFNSVKLKSEAERPWSEGLKEETWLTGREHVVF